jgi:hypothetical protein
MCFIILTLSVVVNDCVGYFTFFDINLFFKSSAARYLALVMFFSSLVSSANVFPEFNSKIGSKPKPLVPLGDTIVPLKIPSPTISFVPS